MAGSWYDDGTGWKLAGPLVGRGSMVAGLRGCDVAEC